MRYEISGTVMQTVGVDLAPGETVYSQNAAMAWMSAGVRMRTNTGGGLFAGLERSFAGGSLFVTDLAGEVARYMPGGEERGGGTVGRLATAGVVGGILGGLLGGDN